MCRKNSDDCRVHDVMYYVILYVYLSDTIAGVNGTAIFPGAFHPLFLLFFPTGHLKDARGGVFPENVNKS